MASPFIYFTKLIVENVRSFADRQVLDLTCANGAPAQWTLIVGENGVGKTTLLQCLARMRPLYSAPSEDRDSKEKIEPEMLREEDNRVLGALARNGTSGAVQLEAHLVAGVSLRGKGKPTPFSTWMKITRDSRSIQEVDGGGSPAIRNEPLVLAYGAGRHMGRANSEASASATGTETLFDSTAELVDASEILYQLDDARLRKRAGAEARLKRLLDVLATVLPDVSSPKQIKIYGLPSPGLTSAATGVRISTPYGEVSLDQLSLGYQTTVAWTVDIATQLFRNYPNSKNALAEPAIVIVDEIDLHLHPRWQREIRDHLTEHFPNVQFIATAHSPLMAQSSLQDNLAIIKRDEDHAVIVSDPSIVHDWRLDQIVTSELFNLKTPWPPDVEELVVEQKALVAKTSRNQEDEQRLSVLKERLLQLPSSLSREDERALELIRRAAARIQEQGEPA